MNKAFVRIIALLVTLILCFGTLISCGDDDEVKNREYDKAEVEAAAKVLIEDSKLLNYIYWGKGIPYVDNKNLSSGNYYPADEDYLNSIGIKTIDDLKKMTEMTYSDKVCQWIYSTVLSSVYSDTAVAGLARYEQVYTGKNNDEPAYIRVYTEADYWLVDEVEYYPTVEALRSEGEIVCVLVLVTVTNPEGKVMNKNLTVRLIEEEDGWRLDAPTYARYYEDYTS